MFQIIITIYYLIKRPKVKVLTADRYPHVPPDQFALWKSLQMKGIDTFLWFSLSSFIVSIVIGFYLGFTGASSDVTVAMQIGFFVIFLGGCGFAAVIEGKAEKIRKQYGFDINKPGPPNAYYQQPYGSVQQPGNAVWPPPPAVQMSSLNCSQCGTPLVVGTMACGSCGQQFNMPVPGGPPPPLA